MGRSPAARAGIDDWLFDACYQAVGDFAETVAHVLPPPAHESDLGLAEWVEDRLLPLRGLPPEEQADARAPRTGTSSTAAGRFLLNKLIGGGFRVGVSRLLVQRALAEGAGVDAKLVAQRMMGYTDGRVAPSPERYLQLTAERRRRAARPRPAVPVLPRPPARCAARRVRGAAGRARRLDRRVEVRRHPRPGGEAGGAGLDLVARRGAGDRALSRDRRRCRRPARTAPCSTARSSSGRTGGSRRSPCCSSASAARR